MPESDSQLVLGNGLKLAGEALIPGASEMLAGNIGSGLLHTALAVGAGALLVGTPLLAGLAVLTVKANSYSRSVTGQNLFGTAEHTAAEGGGRRATSRTTAA